MHDVHGGPLNEARRAHVGKAELDHLKRALLAASYTCHGTDLHGLFDHYDRNGDHELSVDELHGVVQKSLPGIVSDAQLHRIISSMDANNDGRVNFKEFANYIGSRHKHETERELDNALISAATHVGGGSKRAQGELGIALAWSVCRSSAFSPLKRTMHVVTG